MTRKLRLHDQRDHLILGEHQGRASEDPKADRATTLNLHLNTKEKKNESALPVMPMSERMEKKMWWLTELLNQAI